MRALVRAPRRKRHLAASHGAEWWTVCDRIVVGARLEVLELDVALIGTVDEDAALLCAECHRALVFAGTVAGARVAAMLAVAS